MRLLAILFGISAVWAFMAWLFGSFVAWNFNPGEWDATGRFVLGGITALCVGLSCSAVLECR